MKNFILKLNDSLKGLDWVWSLLWTTVVYYVFVRIFEENGGREVWSFFILALSTRFLVGVVLKALLPELAPGYKYWLEFAYYFIFCLIYSKLIL